MRLKSLIASYKTLKSNEQQTFKLHLLYSFVEGILAGVLALNEFVLVKSLQGTNYQIGFLLQFSVIVLLISIILNELLRRTLRKRKFLRVISVITRTPLLLFAFFDQELLMQTNPLLFQYTFLSIFLIFFLANPLIMPTINLLLKNSYEHENFGKLYGYATTLNKIVMLFVTFLFGLWLDFDWYAFRFVYPALGVLGIFSIFTLTRIEYNVPESTEFRRSFWQSVGHSGSKMVRIMRTNIPYRDFELGFMLYGFAFMIVTAVIPIFFENVLHLNYSSVAFYKNAYNTLAIVLLPFFGSLIGRIDPRKFGIFTFGALMMFVFFLSLTEFFPYYITIWEIDIYYTLIISYLFHGVFAATMALLWFIGSAYFCKKEEAGDYQSIHLTLTGVRGLIAPLFGIYFYEIIGFFGVFSLGVILLLASVLLMVYSTRKHPVPKEVIHN